MSEDRGLIWVRGVLNKGVQTNARIFRDAAVPVQAMYGRNREEHSLRIMQ